MGIEIRTFKVAIEGIRPLIMHNGQLADPLNVHAKRMKEVTRLPTAQKNTEEMQIKLSRYEFEGSMYLGADGQPVIPSDNLEKMMQDGATSLKKGKQFKAAVSVVEDEVDVLYEGPRDLDEMFELRDNRGHVHRFQKRARPTKQASVQRTRCRFPKWALIFTVQVMPEAGVDDDDIRKALDCAGRVKGLGDWIPKYGLFQVTKFSR